MKTVKISVFVRDQVGGGMNRWSTEDFLGSENTLYNTIIMDISHYTCVQTHRLYNGKSEQ